VAERDFVERMGVHPDSLFYQEHLQRYRFAKDHLAPGLTLDIACGSGYGTALLGHNDGISAIGADVDFPTVVAARHEYAEQRYLTTSGTALPFASGTFQNVVTLETLEHIHDDAAYLRELARILRPDGACVLSTPDRAHSARYGLTNPYHIREYIEGELVSLLRPNFEDVDVFYQGFSERYQRERDAYVAMIQTRKQQLNPLFQFGIDHAYRPLKRLVPRRTTNFFIHRLLRLPFPQPNVVDISISREPLTDHSGFVVVAKRPLARA
jgi:SAM-dependent methyltransferase